MEDTIERSYSAEEISRFLSPSEKPHGLDPISFLRENASYRLTPLPLSEIAPNEAPEQYDATTRPERARLYASRTSAFPPIIVARRRSALWGVVDGGHRVTAALLRDDTSIQAIYEIRVAP